MALSYTQWQQWRWMTQDILFNSDLCSWFMQLQWITGKILNYNNNKNSKLESFLFWILKPLNLDHIWELSYHTNSKTAPMETKYKREWNKAFKYYITYQALGNALTLLWAYDQETATARSMIWKEADCEEHMGPKQPFPPPHKRESRYKLERWSPKTDTELVFDKPQVLLVALWVKD